MASPELACIYAAFILNDDGIEITKEKINSILNASGVNVESYWTELFAEYFKNHDISELIKNISLGGTHEASIPQDKELSEFNEDKKDDKNEEEDVEIAGGFDDLFN